MSDDRRAKRLFADAYDASAGGFAASADRLVWLLVQVRDRLPAHLTVPYVARPLLERMTDKASFSQVCEELGVPHPRTVVVDCAVEQDPDTSGLTFPVFAKAASTVEYAKVSFPGKSKGFVVASRADLPVDEITRRAASAAFPSRVTSGAELERFRGNAKPIHDDEALDTPRPPWNVFGLPPRT